MADKLKEAAYDDIPSVEEAKILEEFLTNGGNRSKAVHAVFPELSEKRKGNLGSEIVKKWEKTGYFEAKKREIITNYGITKQVQIERLNEIVARCMEGKQKMTWERNERGKPELVPMEDGDGNPVYEFDSRGAIAAIAEQNKMCGLHAPTKIDGRVKVSKEIVPKWMTELEETEEEMVEDVEEA